LSSVEFLYTLLGVAIKGATSFFSKRKIDISPYSANTHTYKLKIQKVPIVSKGLITVKTID
jgi:hypothetical protein